jgi:hypothetical protein
MKTPQATWDAEVAKNIAAVKAEGVRLEMVSMLADMRAKLAKASGFQAESLRESIADIETMIAEIVLKR